jgi:hypothetical protein
MTAAERRRVYAVAFDPGASFGFAWVPAWRIKSDPAEPLDATPAGCPLPENTGAWNLATAREPGERFELLLHHLGEFRPRYVIWETAPGLRGQALRWHAGYLAMGQRWAWLEGATFVGINVATVKATVPGKENASKTEVHRCAREADPRLEPLGPDALDAYLTLRWWWDRPSG